MAVLRAARRDSQGGNWSLTIAHFAVIVVAEDAPAPFCGERRRYEDYSYSD